MKVDKAASEGMSESAAVAKMSELVTDDENAEVEADPAKESENAEGETDQDGATEAEGSESEQGDEGQDEDQEADGEGDKKLFNEKQQEVFDKRVGKEVQKRKAAEERATAAEKKAAELEAKIDPSVTKAATVANIPADYLSKAEAKTVTEFVEWKNVQKFCRMWPDGYEAKNDSEQTYTRDQIADWLYKATDRLEEVGPEARALIRTKSQQAAADAALGRKIRLERESAASKKPAKTPQAAAKPAAMAPGTPRTPGRGMNKDRFLKGGANTEAAIKELANLVTD